MQKSDFYVYSHNRLGSGVPFYVGKGRGKRAGARSKRNAHWNNVVNKGGGFDVSFIAKGLDEELAFLVEIEMIDKFRRIGVVLTNKTDGGEGSSGSRRSEESRAKMRAAAAHRMPVAESTKRKMSEALLGNKRRLGIPHTDVAKRKMSESRLGRTSYVRTPETRAKISAAKTGLPSPQKGIPRSAEVKEKIRKIIEARGPIKQSQEALEKRAKAMRAIWAARKADPTYSAPKQSVESGRKKSAAMKKIWADKKRAMQNEGWEG